MSIYNSLNVQFSLSIRGDDILISYNYLMSYRMRVKERLWAKSFTEEIGKSIRAWQGSVENQLSVHIASEPD